MICRLFRRYRLSRAREAAERAQDAFNRAWAAGDTREVNRTHRALYEARHAVMRLELGR